MSPRLPAWLHQAREKGWFYAVLALVSVAVWLVGSELVKDRFVTEANRWIDAHAGEVTAMVLDGVLGFFQSGAVWWWVPVPTAILLLTIHAYIDAWRDERRLASPASTNPLPLTPRERSHRLADELEAEVARRDQLSHPARLRVGDDYKSFLPEARSLYDEFFKLKNYGPGEFAHFAQRLMLNRGDALALAQYLRNINWEND